MKPFHPHDPCTLGTAISVLGVALLASILLVFGTPSRVVATSETLLAATRYVAFGGIDVGACIDPMQPCQTITYALCQAVSGDEVRVAAGIYPEELQVTKTISLTGGFTNTNWLTPTWTVNQTILDGQHTFRPLTIIAEDVQLDGFVVRNGNASNTLLRGGRGGGLLIGTVDTFVNRAKLINLRLENNVANNGSSGGGGGLLAAMGNPTTTPAELTLHNVTVVSNTAATRSGVTAVGGGITVFAVDNSPINVELSSVTVQGNTGSNNGASFGGGVALFLKGGSATLRQSRILDNQSTKETPTSGALSTGGGVYVENSDLFLENVLIANNESEHGSALSVQTDILMTSTVGMNYVTIADNNGFASGAETASITLRSVGIPVKVFLANTLISDSQIAFEVQDSAALPTPITFNHLLIADNVSQVISGTAQTVGTPLRGVADYVDASTGDYHLRATSSAIDKGFTLPPLIDLDGTPRPQSVTSDIGAFEFIPPGKTNQIITFDPLPDVQLGTPPLRLKATASSGLPVTFASLRPMVCTVNGTLMTLLTTGICTVEASQVGDANFNPAPPVARYFVVTDTRPSEPALTFDKPADKRLGDLPFTLSARTTSGLPIRFTSNTPEVCAVNDALVTLLAAGVCSVTATVVGDGPVNPPPSLTHEFNILVREAETSQKLFLPIVAR